MRLCLRAQEVTQAILSGAIRANLAPLRVPAFGRLLFSYTTNSIGDYVGLVALAVLVYGETEDPLATTALFITVGVVHLLVTIATRFRSREDDEDHSDTDDALA